MNDDFDLEALPVIDGPTDSASSPEDRIGEIDLESLPVIDGGSESVEAPKEKSLSASLLMLGGGTVEDAQSKAALSDELSREAEFRDENAKTPPPDETSFAGKTARYIGDLWLSAVSGLLEGISYASEGVNKATGADRWMPAFGLGDPIESGRQFREDVRNNIPANLLDTSGGGIGDKILQTGKGVAHVAGEFAPAAIPGYTAAYITGHANERKDQIYEAAKARGASEVEARALSYTAGGADAFYNMLMMGKFKGVWSGSKGKAANLLKRDFITSLVPETGSMSAIMGAQGGTNAAIDALSAKNSLSAEEIAEGVKDGAVEGMMFHIVNSGAHAFAHGVKWDGQAKNERAEFARRVIEQPSGRALLYANSPEAAKEIVQARIEGKDVSQEMLAKIGIPKQSVPTQTDCNNVADMIVSDAGKTMLLANKNSESGKKTEPTTKIQEKPTNETRADEASAQPEQGEVVAAPAGEAARPVESAEARPEAPREGVVRPQMVENRAEAAQEPAEMRPAVETGETPPAHAEGVENASRASGTEQVRTGEVASPEPPAPSEPPKSNRLRRRDGTDPLAKEKPMPKTLRNAVDKISLAIGNRAGSGVVTPEEADGIVRGIAESPETKHNRYRDFFNPLANDAKWHESLGLDAESAKNVRDAVDKVKTDADLKKWFTQVDAAVKKANDGKLSKKDAVPLFGKISEGLEKAERMGLSETAKRLRDAAEVIRPIAETITQGDVNKFNYSTKGRKLNNRLGGTDRRGGKTVSLDTRDGTVDVAADGKTLDDVVDEIADSSHDTRSLKSGESYGKGFTGNEIDAGGEPVEAPAPASKSGSTGTGGSLGGNRHLIIDGVNGDELTVTMKDAAGKTLATRKMNRAQWSALAKGAVATDGDPAAPQKGDLIRMSRSDATDAPQSWTPETQKPLERVAHALRNVVTVGGKRLKVEFLNERPTDADGQTRKSVGGVFTGTAADYANRSRQGGVDDGPSVKHIGTGEGSQVYGWGLYGSTVRGVAEGYGRGDVFQKRQPRRAGRFELNGKRIPEEISDRLLEFDEDGSTYFDGTEPNAEFLLKGLKDSGVKAELEYKGVDVDTVVKAIEENKDGVRFVSETEGNLYEQTFFTDRAPGDESHLLKWYSSDGVNKLSKKIQSLLPPEQSDSFRKAMNRSMRTSYGARQAAFGEDLYNNLADTLGSPKAASEFLREKCDIDGVKYPVDSYRGPIRDGNKVGWNYVSFRDDNIRVDHKWTDGELRYMRNSDGMTVGEYDAAKGEIRLYPGAKVADVVHEFTHPLVDFARAEAEAGRGELLGKINQIIDAERATWEQPVRDAYKGKSNETILEEIFTHAMGEKGADLFGKSTKTLQGRRWYNRLWEAIKGVWQDFATKMGWNKADLRGLERMSPEDAAQKILSEMAKGRNFGDAPRGEGTAEARSVTPPPAPTTKDIADWLDGKDDVRRKWRRALQDKNIGIRDVEEKLGITDKNESAYYAKDRAFGKNEHELTVLQKQEVEPIVEKIHKSGGDLGLFSAYLYARHAGERNAVLKAEKGVDNGSGMNDAQTKTIFDAVDRLGLRAAFEDAAKDVWAMNRKYLQRRVDSGRMTQAEAKFLMDRYQHYVPLRTDMTNEELDIFNSTTGGWKRNETMTAEGRKSAADDPLAFSIVQNEQAIRASNANEVRRRWAGVVRRSKGELGEIVDGVNKGTAKWAFTFGDGETVETGSPMKLASERDDIILFKENGQLKAIKMKPGEHGRGLDLARAVTDKDVAQFNRHLDWIPRATRWMSAMRTQYVPTFIIRNLKADNLEVMLNALSERGLRGENGKSGGVAFFGKFLKNEFSVAKGVREYFKTGKSSDRYVQEAVENGLLTGGGMAAEGFTETARRLSDTLQALRERPKLLGGTLKAAKDTISLLNSCAEYNTRIGVYKTLREEGMSVADAVSYARDVTVNFNRKGYLTPYTNAAFMFSNAAIQGMGRAFKSMGSEHGKGVIAGLFMVGVAQALLDDWLGHDDEKAKSGGADSRNMTEYDKEHSLGVALPTGHRVKTGIRNPWALPMYAGRKTVELIKGVTSGEQAMKDLANAVGNFVSEPVGGNGFGSKAEFLQTIAPTIIDPFVQWGTGKDYRGQDRLKKSFDKTAPQSWNGKERTPDAYKLIAQGLNALTGGNEFRKGWVDSAPEDWQLLAESVFGGVLTDLNNVVKAGGHAVDVARGKPAAQIARDIPFVRDTFTNLPENSNRYYAALEDYERDKAEFKKTTPERRKEMKADKPYLFIGKSLLDRQIETVREYMHRERGEVKDGRKWVKPKTPRTEEQKEAWHKKRLALQARILERLGR